MASKFEIPINRDIDISVRQEELKQMTLDELREIQQFLEREHPHFCNQDTWLQVLELVQSIRSRITADNDNADVLPFNKKPLKHHK